MEVASLGVLGEKALPGQLHVSRDVNNKLHGILREESSRGEKCKNSGEERVSLEEGQEMKEEWKKLQRCQ